jgi:hypothetical protein
MIERMAAAMWHRIPNFFFIGFDFRFVAYLFVALPLALFNTLPARAVDCATPPASAVNSKLGLALDHPTVWQTRGGEVRFTITGLDPTKDNPTVVACLRWKQPPAAKQPALVWTPLQVIRVGTTSDKTGLIFAVTIPELADPPANVDSILFGSIPTAELRILAAEGTGQPAVELDATRDIRVTAKWLAALLAFSFAIGIGVLLYFFAKNLGVPGGRRYDIPLRIISTARGWASLAQFQIILWTLVIGAGAVYVMTLTGELISITDGTLILLGIAGAAAVGSQLHATREAQGSTTVNPPGQVTALGAAAPDESSFTLSWQPPTGGSAPKNYAVQYRPAPATGTTAVAWMNATTGVETPRFTLVGLVPATAYDVQVFALNDAGSSAPAITQVTTAAAARVPSNAPAKVEGLVRNGDPMATIIPLTWQRQDAVTYSVQYRIHDSDQTWRTAKDNVTGEQVKVDSLIPDRAYDFRVRAQANGVVGPWSEVLQVSTGSRKPRWSDIIRDTDRAPEIDVTRVQMLFFTVISAFFVVFGIATGSTIPEIPASYVTLMGISNGVYLTAKFMR